MFRAQIHVTLALIKIGLNGQTGVFSSLFQCNFISFICQLINLGIFANLDPGRMVLFIDAPG